MIITLPHTTTRTISKTLVKHQEDYAMATGRVLTLIVVADAGDDIDAILSAVRDASHEHPSRVLVVLSNHDSQDSLLDAKVLFGGDSGASETVVMTLHGAMADHPASLVTPLLLPDTPIVAWWPTQAPEDPSAHPIGEIAQRRITNTREGLDGAALQRLTAGYRPGDSDMMWSRITSWRGILASAVDRPPHDAIDSVTICGSRDPSVDIAAGWLANRLGVPVERVVAKQENPELFPIYSTTINRASGAVIIEATASRTIRVRVPGQPPAQVAMDQRSTADCLAEELRHLDPDLAYASALFAIREVTVTS